MTNKYICILLNEFIILRAHVLTTVCVANTGEGMKQCKSDFKEVLNHTFCNKTRC